MALFYELILLLKAFLKRLVLLLELLGLPLSVVNNSGEHRSRSLAPGRLPRRPAPVRSRLRRLCPPDALPEGQPGLAQALARVDIFPGADDVFPTHVDLFPFFLLVWLVGPWVLGSHTGLPSCGTSAITWVRGGLHLSC